MLAPMIAVELMLATLTATQPVQETTKMTLQELREARRELAHRRRRLITNNDGCDALYFPRDREANPENFLAQRTTELAGTHVDTIAYCTISSGFSYFTHRTQVGTILTHSPADFGIEPEMRNITQDLLDQGTDPLQCVVEFAHAHGLEVFWSMRMNDTHDVEHTPERPYFLFPPLKVAHPEWLVGDHVKRTPYGRWSSVNYAQPEIRDLAFRFIEEVCRNYDVDGVELDFFRHLCYFASVANGGLASPEERNMMTDLLRRVRTMTEEVGLERERPLLIAVRVPDSLDFSRDMGLDLERWLQEGLVDLLITTCYFRLNPWEYSVELGHKYGVAVYPCLSDSRVQGESRFHRSSLESYRGRAMNAWAAGADGIHLFNYSNPKGAVFRELGDPQVLAQLDKLYFLTVRDGNPNSWLAGGARYQTIPILTPSHPASISPSKPLTLELPIGEVIGERRSTVMLHLWMPGVTHAERLIVKLNGTALGHATLTDGWIDFPVPPTLLKRGANHLEIALNPPTLPTPDEWTITWEGTAKPQAPWYRDPGSERTEERLENGALFIADRGTVAGDYLYYRYPWGAEPDKPLVVEARVKAVSGASFVIIDNGVGHERLGIWPDHLDLWRNRNVRHDMDTTDDFHTYRLEVEGRDLRVYVDGTLCMEVPEGFAAGGSQNMLAFGAANSGMEGEAYWQQVRCRVTGQGLRDLVVSVKYPH